MDSNRIKILGMTILLICLFHSAFAQQLNNEEIWYQGSFGEEHVPGFNFLKDGIHYSELRRGKIVQSNFLKSKEKSTVLFDSGEWEETLDGKVFNYQFSPNEQYILLWTKKEPIYRRSFKARAYLYDRHSKKLSSIREEKVQIVHFSPDSRKLAYLLENDLYTFDIETTTTRRISNDGVLNQIINGHADWVYEEEFGITRLYEWSENGRYLAYLQFDEREVPEFSMRYYDGGLYPNDYTFKYPKVGENNATLRLKIYDWVGDKTAEVTAFDFQHYIPRIQWVPKSNTLCITDINRHQNHLRLNMYNAENGKVKTILEEKSDFYLEIKDDLRFDAAGQSFFWTSPRSGYNHIYHYAIDGELLQQITEGEWPVTKFYGFNEKRKELFYQAATQSPMRREIYRYDLNKKAAFPISRHQGFHTATFNNTLEFYIDQYSSLNQPSVYSIVDREGVYLKEMKTNDGFRNLQDQHHVEKIQFLKIPNDQGDSLNAYIIPPSDFDENKTYPLLMYVYGGPGSQQVLDRLPRYYWWFQMLSKKGYYIACVDGRGTGARGDHFKKSTYLQLGRDETKDQIAAARYLGNMKSIDPLRIGIFGWSYGGYLSTLCVLKGADVFSTGVAVAPVTNWKWYDSIYTERFMRTEKENPDGYADNSPVNFAALLEGNYLIVHGTGDDNVHPQHSYEMVNELIRHNKKFDMAFYPNKNHGIYGSFTRWHLFDHITKFIEESL